MAMAMDQIEGVPPVPVQQLTAVTSAEHTVVVVDEEVQISEAENNTGWLRLCFFVYFTLLQRFGLEGVHPGSVRPVPVQQPVEVEPPGHAEVDEGVRIPEPDNGPLGFLVLMVRSLASIALGQNRSDPIWRLNLLTTINLVIAAMIGLISLPKAHHDVHETYYRVMVTMTVVVPIVVAMVTLLATIWIRRNDRQGRKNWITGLSVANVSMLAGPVVLYCVTWVHRNSHTGN